MDYFYKLDERVSRYAYIPLPGLYTTEEAAKRDAPQGATCRVVSCCTGCFNGPERLAVGEWFPERAAEKTLANHP